MTMKIRFLVDARWGDGWDTFRTAGQVEWVPDAAATTLVAGGLAVADSVDPETPLSQDLHSEEDTVTAVDDASGATTPVYEP